MQLLAVTNRELRAFTLIELIVVVVVLGVLATIAIVGYGTITKDAEENVAQANLAAFTKAIMTHHTNEGAPELTRAMTLDALANSSPGVVDGGVGAEGSWKLFGKDHQVSSPNEFAIGFAATPGGEVNNDGGRFAVLTAYSGEKTYAHSINYSGVPTWGNVDSENAAGSTPAELIESIPVPEPDPVADLIFAYDEPSVSSTVGDAVYRPTITSSDGEVYFSLTQGAEQLPEGATFDQDGTLTIPAVEGKIIDVASSGGSVFLVSDTGALYAAGDSSMTFFGDGSTSGTATIANPVTVPIPEKVTKVSTAENVTMAVTESGELYTWGKAAGNGHQQHGHGVDDLATATKLTLAGVPGVADVSTGELLALVLDKNGGVWELSGPSAKLSEVKEITSRVVSIDYRSRAHAITDGGTLYYWYDYMSGMPVNPYTPQRIDLAGGGGRYIAESVTEGPEGYSYAVSDGDIYEWHYSNLTPQKISGLPKVKSVVADAHNIFAITTNGEVYGKGKNDKGQVGLGHTDDVATFTKIPGLSGVERLNTHGSGGHPVAVTGAGDVYTWGDADLVYAREDQPPASSSPSWYWEPQVIGSMNIEGHSWTGDVVITGEDDSQTTTLEVTFSRGD